MREDDVHLVTAADEPCSPSLRVYRARAGNEANPHDVSNGPSCGGSADGLLVLSAALSGLIQGATVGPTPGHYTVPFLRLTPLRVGIGFEPATHCPVLVRVAEERGPVPWPSDSGAGTQELVGSW